MDARRRVCAAPVPYRWATRGTSLWELDYTHVLLQACMFVGVGLWSGGRGGGGERFTIYEFQPYFSPSVWGKFQGVSKDSRIKQDRTHER